MSQNLEAPTTSIGRSVETSCQNSALAQFEYRACVDHHGHAFGISSDWPSPKIPAGTAIADLVGWVVRKCRRIAVEPRVPTTRMMSPSMPAAIVAAVACEMVLNGWVNDPTEFAPV